MSLATITSKGQTTIPKNIRDCLGLQPKDQIQFTMIADGTVLLRVKKRSLKELYGVLYESTREPVQIEEMKSWR